MGTGHEDGGSVWLKCKKPSTGCNFGYPVNALKSAKFRGKPVAGGPSMARVMLCYGFEDGPGLVPWELDAEERELEGTDTAAMGRLPGHLPKCRHFWMKGESDEIS